MIMDTRVVLEVLVELAGLEDELASLKVVRRKNVTRKKSLKELADEYRDDEIKARAEGLANDMEYRDHAGRLEALEEALADRRDKLVGLKEPRQYKLLKDEVLSLERQIDKLENEALGVLDKGDDKARKVVEAVAGRKDQKNTLMEESQDHEGRNRRTEAAEKEILQDIERLIGMLPQVEQRQVIRLRSKLDQSCIWVSGSGCGACFEQLPTQKALEVQKGKNYVRCPGCARLIVHRPWK
jgi:predicted  nucleic acid-binding Zn-ribbon protein